MLAYLGGALAGEALYLTPPLFREQAQETQQVRSVSDLTTTPQPAASAQRLYARPVHSLMVPEIRPFSWHPTGVRTTEKQLI